MNCARNVLFFLALFAFALPMAGAELLVGFAPQNTAGPYERFELVDYLLVVTNPSPENTPGFTVTLVSPEAAPRLDRGRLTTTTVSFVEIPELSPGQSKALPFTVWAKETGNPEIRASYKTARGAFTSSVRLEVRKPSVPVILEVSNRRPGLTDSITLWVRAQNQLDVNVGPVTVSYLPPEDYTPAPARQMPPIPPLGESRVFFETRQELAQTGPHTLFVSATHRLPGERVPRTFLYDVPVIVEDKRQLGYVLVAILLALLVVVVLNPRKAPKRARPEKSAKKK